MTTAGSMQIVRQDSKYRTSSSVSDMRHIIPVTLPEVLFVTCDNLLLGYISSSQRKQNNDNITCFSCYYLTLVLGSVLCSNLMRWVGHVACMGEGRGEVCTGDRKSVV